MLSTYDESLYHKTRTTTKSVSPSCISSNPPTSPSPSYSTPGLVYFLPYLIDAGHRPGRHQGTSLSSYYISNEFEQEIHSRKLLGAHPLIFPLPNRISPEIVDSVCGFSLFHASLPPRCVGYQIHTEDDFNDHETIKNAYECHGAEPEIRLYHSQKSTAITTKVAYLIASALLNVNESALRSRS